MATLFSRSPDPESYGAAAHGGENNINNTSIYSKNDTSMNLTHNNLLGQLGGGGAAEYSLKGDVSNAFNTIGSN